jgi:hypothetical protein
VGRALGASGRGREEGDDREAACSRSSTRQPPLRVAGCCVAQQAAALTVAAVVQSVAVHDLLLAQRGQLAGVQRVGSLHPCQPAKSVAAAAEHSQGVVRGDRGRGGRGREVFLARGLAREVPGMQRQQRCEGGWCHAQRISSPAGRAAHMPCRVVGGRGNIKAVVAKAQ